MGLPDTGRLHSSFELTTVSLTCYIRPPFSYSPGKRELRRFKNTRCTVLLSLLVLVFLYYLITDLHQDEHVLLISLTCKLLYMTLQKIPKINPTLFLEDSPLFISSFFALP